MWIEKKDKLLFCEHKYNGIRLKFFEGISKNEIEKIKKFCAWISKRYWFPIRCNLYFIAQKKFKSINDGHFYYGVFYSNENDNRRKYPCICIATYFKNREEEFSCYFNIVHELTHYFQWYFYEDKEKSNRSLEINANKWANYIIWLYENNKR